MNASSGTVAGNRSEHRRSVALSGVTVVVTRPAGDARAALAAARARGAHAIALPGMALRAAAGVAASRARLQAARDAQAWIFTSPAAVRFAFHAWPDLALDAATRVVAPGAGTRQALARQGIAALAPADRFDSEGVLALPELADVVGLRVVLIGAPGGREMIAPALRERGATVDAVDVYARKPPRLSAAQRAAFERAAAPIATLLSSAAALTHLLHALPAAARVRWRTQALIVSSARLATLAATLGFDDVHIAASASTGDLLDAAERAIARHRL